MLYRIFLPLAELVHDMIKVICQISILLMDEIMFPKRITNAPHFTVEYVGKISKFRYGKDYP